MAKTRHTVPKCHKRVLTIRTQQAVRKSVPPKGTTSVIGQVSQTIERNSTGILKRYNMPPVYWGNWVTPQKYVRVTGVRAEIWTRIWSRRADHCPATCRKPSWSGYRNINVLLNAHTHTHTHTHKSLLCSETLRALLNPNLKTALHHVNQEENI
jgi:hypothetical protein